MSGRKKVGKSMVGRIKILRDFIPSKLFAESNLPEVNINVIDEKRLIKKEDVSLALSSAGYLPGKPTFRIRPDVGSFIPLDNLLNTKKKDNSEKIDEIRAIITKITTRIGNNEIMLYNSDSPKSYNELELDEYKYLLNEVLNKVSVTLYPVREITVLPFYRKTETYCARWLFYMRLRTNFEFNRIKDKQFYVYLDKSNAYARFSVFSPEGQIIPRTRICKNHGEKVVEIKGNITNIKSIFHGVYAIDVRAALRGKFKRGGQGYCIFDVPINSTCITPTKGCSYAASFVKIFTDSKGNPVILGYEIKNTKLLNLDLDIDEEIWSSIMNVLDGSLVNSSQDMGYRTFSLNTIIVNALRHYLSHDLVILYYLSSLGFTKFDRLINLLILLNDIFGIKAIVDIVKGNYKKASQELIEKIRVFENELKQPWVLVLRYILTTVMEGGRLEKYRMFHERDNSKEEEKWNKIKNRLEHILNKYEKYSFNNRWHYGVILDVIKHTYSHHLIRSVSSRLSVNPEKFTENYREMEESLEISIFEKDSGGIGILEKAFDKWKNEKQSTVTDLILSSGKCLVGTPEDLLHFAIVNQDTCGLLFKNTDDSVRRAIRMIIERLGIVVTPDEFEETIRLWRSIYKEALRLVQVLKNASKTDSENLLKEVHKLRYELEKEIRRFPEMDELIAYLIKELGRYPTLDRLFRALLRANAQAMSKELDNLKKLYGEDYVDKFVDDVIYILKSRKDNASNDSQKEILDCVTKKRRNNNSDLCKSIISMLKLMGRVIRGMLMRISLLSCNGACGMCYVNTKSCSRFGAPFIQQRTLDRRALKILASELIKKGGKELNPEDYYKHKDIDVIELGGKQYLFRCD